MSFLLLLSERGLSPDSCLAICLPELVAYETAAYKENKCIENPINHQRWSVLRKELKADCC